MKIRSLFRLLHVSHRKAQAREKLMGGAVEFCPDPLLTLRIGQYRATRELARGNMSVVYEARHDVIGQRAAVKVLLSSRDAASKYSRLLHKARAMSLVQHPGMVRIFDFTGSRQVRPTSSWSSSRGEPLRLGTRVPSARTALTQTCCVLHHREDEGSGLVNLAPLTRRASSRPPRTVPRPRNRRLSEPPVGLSWCCSSSSSGRYAAAIPRSTSLSGSGSLLGRNPDQERRLND